MPELPEVETIKRGLASKIVGLKINKIDVLNSKSFQGDPDLLIGATITNVWRRAKVLGIDLKCHLFEPERPQSRRPKLVYPERSRGVSGSKMPKQVWHDSEVALTLLIHLKMSGQLIFIGNWKTSPELFESEPEGSSLRAEWLAEGLEFRDSEPYRLSGGHPTSDMFGDMPNNSTRVIFHLSSSSLTGGSMDSRRNLSRTLIRGGNDSQKNLTLHPSRFTLYFNDQRKFGWIKIASSEQLLADSFLSKLGPEPLEKDFTPEILKLVLSKHPKLPIKVAILDQSVIAGIGNIYASESCFLAGVHPTTPVAKLTEKDFHNLHRAIIDSLQASIKYGGSSRHTYVNESGEKGYFLEVANVYDRQDLPCRKCKSLIQKITLAGRGTYFCPVCQPPQIK